MLMGMLGAERGRLLCQHLLQSAKQTEEVAVRGVPRRIGSDIILLQERVRDDVAVMPGKRARALLRLLGRYAEQRRILQHACGYVLMVVGCYVGGQDTA